MQPEDSVNNRKMRAFTTCVKALNDLMIQQSRRDVNLVLHIRATFHCNDQFFER